MNEVQEQIFDCLRDVAEFAHCNKLHRLQGTVDRVEEAALLEVCGIDLSNPIPIEDFTDEPRKLSLFRAKAKV